MLKLLLAANILIIAVASGKALITKSDKKLWRNWREISNIGQAHYVRAPCWEQGLKSVFSHFSLRMRGWRIPVLWWYVQVLGKWEMSNRVTELCAKGMEMWWNQGLHRWVWWKKMQKEITRILPGKGHWLQTQGGGGGRPSARLANWLAELQIVLRQRLDRHRVLQLQQHWPDMFMQSGIVRRKEA